jgi:hypothetical protein
MMDVTNLEIECHADGGSKVTAWTKCRSTEDIDDLVAWLGLARGLMVEWQSIRATRRHYRDGENVTPIKKGKEP